MRAFLPPFPSRLLVIAMLVAAACVSWSCSGGGNDDDSGGDDGGSPLMTPDATGNYFPNPGFEEGADPWFTLEETAGFRVTDEYAHSGSNSAVLEMDDPADASGQGKVYYLVQDLTPEELPEVVEGYYRVENWERGTRLQYLQFVVIALGPDNNPTASTNFQLRYIIGGIDAPPFDIGNAHFVFLSRDDPVLGEWTEFSANIREDFERLWGVIPENFDSLRLLFEVRWDHKSSGSGAPRADVYYDDLYLGDAR